MLCVFQNLLGWRLKDIRNSRLKEREVYLLLGSNINPEENILQAVKLLKTKLRIATNSSVWETEAVGSNGPNFLNFALKVCTTFSLDELKKEILTPIEERLGRIRTSDKNAPRTIDIDVLVYDDQIVDDAIWQQIHVALPLVDIKPDLIEPGSNTPLWQITQRMMQRDKAIKRNDLDIMIKKAVQE